MVEHISRMNRKAKKPHQCFHCYRDISKGELHDVFTGKDDYIYTIRSHIDCMEMSHERCEIIGWSDYYDGIPPLWDELQESGEFELECSQWRGYYPHVVTRMEHNQQEIDIRYGRQ